ncbi:unnamed protein product, partial [Amoebophrya sp. A25]|eukprot:GSA25T00019054001.1
MFSGFANFDADLGGWDVSKATSMRMMFQSCVRFRGRGLESWDVSSVTDMTHMFECNFALDAFLGSWDVSSVRNMTGLFIGAIAMKGEGISAWNVANVTDMSSIFSRASSFNEPNLGKWNVAAVERVGGALRGATKFAQPLNDWDLSKAFNTWRDEISRSPARPFFLTFDTFMCHILCDTDIYSDDPGVCKLSRALWPRDPTKKTTEGHIAVSPVSRASASKSPPWTVESTEMLSGLSREPLPS